ATALTDDPIERSGFGAGPGGRDRSGDPLPGVGETVRRDGGAPVGGSRSPPGRVFRSAGAERCGEDDDDRDPGRTPEAGCGWGGGTGSEVGERRARAAATSGDPVAGDRTP